MDAKVLLVDDEAIIRKILKAELALQGFIVDTAKNGVEALEMIKKRNYDVIVLDNLMPHKTGMEVLQSFKNTNSVIILITAYASIQGAVEAIKQGADDYLTKPFDSNELVEKINQCLAIKKLSRKASPDNQAETNSEIIGVSPLIKNLKQQVEKIKNLDSTILILGENGTGKSVLAKEIHTLSNRKNESFIHVDCASLPANLIDSELFGHQKGAFTNAIENRRGKFEQAGKGTILLDEISLLPLELQGKLLNVLQERTFTRIGGEKQYHIEAKILAATNENLEEAVRRRTFREDLFYRLNVIKLVCPPLRFRKEDIRLLSYHFLKTHSAKFGIEHAEITDEAISKLQEYSWPGNVRELENMLEGVLALSDDNIITVNSLPIRIRGEKKATAPSTINLPVQQSPAPSKSYSLKDQEFKTIARALENNDGHREKTAKELGISRRTLQYKIKEMQTKNTNNRDGEL